VVGLAAGAGFDDDPRGGKSRAEVSPAEAEGEGLVAVVVGEAHPGSLEA
jgi:hypothetical protein